MKDKKQIYEEVVQELQKNDHNGNYDLILKENGNNLDDAILNLYNVLHRIVHEEMPQGEELEFYKDNLVKIGILKSIYKKY